MLGAMLALAVAAASEGEAIVITAQRGASRVAPPTAELDTRQLLELQPRSAAEAVDALPGVSVRANSRGETIARLRGSDERQTAIFLDGTPLAVPWDGRVDIGILPAGLIGKVGVTKGAVPFEFGANAIGGGVDLQSRVAAQGAATRLTMSGSAGSLGFADGAAVALLPAGAARVTVAASFLSRDAEPVASPAALPFSQPSARRRLNTSLDSASLFAAVGAERGPLSLRGFVLHLDAKRGIAPESDRDPAIDAPRYWRYPHIAQTQAGLATRLALGPGSAVQLVLWRQWFGQTIIQYGDAHYDTATGRQKDRDDTLGGRLVLTGGAGDVGLRVVASGQTSRHVQGDNGAAALTYRQNMASIAAEADVAIGAGRATFGLGYDRSANPRTGDKPAQRARGAVAFSAAYRVAPSKDWEFTLSGGRRSRFPTARELFGEALGRFLLNPGLRPEQAWLADAELGWRRAGVSVAVNPFVSRIDDVIAQRVVTVDGRRLRQRVNLSGSWTYGVDFAARADLSPKVAVELAATMLRARADKGQAAFRQLPQRPWLDVEAALAWRPTERWSLRGELHHVGGAVDLAPDGARARLAAGTEVNFRARWQALKLAAGGRLWLTGSIDNATDALITPQLGLPLAGRSVRIGFRVE